MFFILMMITLTGGTMDLQWNAVSEPVISSTSIGDRIEMEGAFSSGLPGFPLKPLVPLKASIPVGAVVDGIEIVSGTERLLSTSFTPMPAQTAVPVSRPGDFVLTGANQDAFSKGISVAVQLQGQGTLMGYPVADILICPFAWNSLNENLMFTESLTLRLTYHIEATNHAIPRRGIVGDAVARGILLSSVVNPQDLPYTAPAADEELPWGEYLIIADDDLAVAFEPLAQFKTWKGIRTEIVNISYITELYPGVDNAQKLRNFLYEIYQDSPPTYILLAGDTPGIPHRNCYATAEGYVDDPSSDLYFQDMNDTAPGVDAWDLDGDGLWGELNGQDNMDYHPDYILGRASVETVSEAEIFVNKVILWENTPDTADWYTSMGFTTGVLWSSPYCPGSAGKEKVDTLYTPETWTITKLYESAGTQSYAATMAMLNTGMQLVNHACHGSETYVAIGPGTLGISDFMGLTNVSANGRPTIWNTIACLSGSFDTGTCLAEAWIRSPGGGGFCIMNTRYGWGEPAEPGGQWSDLVDQEFFAKFFTEDMYQLGVAYMMAKDEFIPLVPVDTHYDWIAKSNTLFGDPELPMYTVEPESIAIDEIVLYEGLTSLTVSVTSEGTPLENARVCLIQGEWHDPVTYAVGITDGSGTVTLTWPDVMPALPNTARLTVWARDHVLLSGIYDVWNMGTGQGSSQTVPAMTMISSNPLRGTASIQWSIPGDQSGTISIMDMSGRTLNIHELQGASGVFSWNSAENPSGIYFIRMTTSQGDVLQQRLVVIR